MHGLRTRLTPVLVSYLFAGCSLDSQESLGHDLPDGGDADGSVHVDVEVDADAVPDVHSRAPGPAPAGDASSPITATACPPGTYIGMFQASLRPLPTESGGFWIGPSGTVVAPDAGAATWSAELIIMLAAATSMPDAGEAGVTSPVATTAQFFGIDSSGDLLTAVLGRFDCSGERLKAELEDGTIRNVVAAAGDAGLTLPLMGSLSATYGGASTSPRTVTGQIHLVVDPFFETVGGTWSATLF